MARFRELGQRGLIDRPPICEAFPLRTPASVVEAICKLRRQHMTAAEIAEVLELALSTVSAVLLRCGLGKRSRLAPPAPPNRYERRHPGELVDVDIKKLGRIAGGAAQRITAHKHYNPRRGPRGAAPSAPSAGNTCTSASMTTRASPMPRCPTTRLKTDKGD